MAEDIVDELEARGDSLSMRAARYIRVKRTTCELLEADRHSMAQKSLESPEPQPGDAK